MEEYTREQLQRADDTDLYVFLSGRGEQFKRCGKEYRWLRHDSVMINKNEWYRFSQNKGGHAIDFMKEFYGLSFAEAVKELLGEEGVGETNRRTAKEDAGRQKVCPIPLKKDWNECLVAEVPVENMAKPGMNPKTLQYLMGHSDISVTMNVYTHIGFDDAEEELKRIEEFRKARAEVEQKKEKPMSQKMFKVI